MAFNYGANPYETEMLSTQYTSKLDMLLQQKTSKLRGLVDSAFYTGKQGSPVNQIGVLEVKQPGGRFSPITPQIPNYTRRWVFPNDRDIAVLVDQFDELRSIVDPKPGISEAVAAAFGRYLDDLIINAANASASTGVDASSLSTESFATTVSTSGGYLVADTFAASASTGMTYPKLVEAWRVMRHAQVDLDAEKPYLLIASQQESDLKKQQEVISRDYGDAMSVTTGMAPPRLAGFNIVVTERLNTSSSDSLRNCLAFVPSGLHLGLWKDQAVKIDNRVDLTSQPWQIYAMISAGATRTQLRKVVQINCADTTGTDPTAP